MAQPPEGEPKAGNHLELLKFLGQSQWKGGSCSANTLSNPTSSSLASCLGHMARVALPRVLWILIPGSGIEPRPLAVKAPSPDHWTAREFPTSNNFWLCTFPLEFSPSRLPSPRGLTQAFTPAGMSFGDRCLRDRALVSLAAEWIPQSKDHSLSLPTNPHIEGASLSSWTIQVV